VDRTLLKGPGGAVAGGGVDKPRRQWKKIKGKYLFSEFTLARVFRARFLATVNQAGLKIPVGAPPKRVVDCAHVGNGLPALKYLSRYLYRGGGNRTDHTRSNARQKLQYDRLQQSQHRPLRQRSSSNERTNSKTSTQ